MSASSASSREAFRAKVVAEIPGWYSPWAHLAFPSLVGIGTIVATLALLVDVKPAEWLTAPIVWVLSNAVEWRIHKFVLHRRFPLFEILYERHTPMHHRVFLTDDMAIRSRREFRLVLLPFHGILGILLIDLPFFVGLWALGQRNVACLFLGTSAFYVISYEWLHLAYHLPEDHFIGRLALVRFLRRHHAIHHAPSLMQKWNFNVTVPLWDLVRRSYYRGPWPAGAAWIERPADGADRGATDGTRPAG